MSKRNELPTTRTDKAIDKASASGKSADDKLMDAIRNSGPKRG